MSGPVVLTVMAEDAPGKRLVFSEHEIARARREVRKALANLRSTDNFLRIERNEGFIATVVIDFGPLGQREVLIDPLNIRKRLRPVASGS